MALRIERVFGPPGPLASHATCLRRLRKRVGRRGTSADLSPDREFLLTNGTTRAYTNSCVGHRVETAPILKIAAAKVAADLVQADSAACTWVSGARCSWSY